MMEGNDEYDDGQAESNNLCLFASNQQNILSALTKPKTMKEWNSLMDEIIL